ncbi:hypothetical protein GGH94_002567 [Coemansia aciculifera]|uniref:Uncharacterized protein n=1 Tax=Coemansia aciculifera TaxID=417176 RepID=A0A9W8INU9_9FUNG|nr:hypothetical protein GGH94_002567 [Coemansia aciculifera]KAJ2874666.1 hypothetical protein GGH93_002243 [Coemansia aciculifera]
MNTSEPETPTLSRRCWADRSEAAAGLLDEQGQNAMIDDMNTMKCDTPEYDDFVKDFISTQAANSKPTVKIARKFCATWPMSKQITTTATIRVAVMDSSFNPPHYCHGAYMECMGIMKLKSEDQRQQRVDETRSLEIDAFLLLLGSQNADKPQQGASLAQRMRMVDMLATTVAVDATSDTWHVWKSRDEFDASNLHNMAIGMVNTPRFIDKCQAVRDIARQEYKGSEVPQVLCFFAMGWDTLIRFFDAKYYGPDYPAEIDQFFAEGGRIAYARRTGFLDSDVEVFFAAARVAPYLRFIYELELPKRVKHISSTEVRRAIIESSHGVRDTPPRILEYVNSNQLYRD